MNIKILGPGCSRCHRLAANTRAAVQQLGIEANVTKVDDIEEIVAYGVMSTPALVVDEHVVLFGRVPATPEIVTLLADAL